MSETPVLLTAELAKAAEAACVFLVQSNGASREEQRAILPLRAIASGQVVCIEAKRLARMETALRYYACATTSPDFDNDIKAREALAAQEVKS